MDEKKKTITRRAAIAGTALAGIGLTTWALILRNLRGRYETNLPDGAPPFVPSRATGSGTMTVNGYTVRVPPVTMEIEKPSDWEKYESLLKEAAVKALENDPGYQAHLERQRAARREKTRREAKERIPANGEQQMEADIQQFDARIDNDDTIDAANKELMKESFRKSLKESYEATAAKIERP